MDHIQNTFFNIFENEGARDSEDCACCSKDHLSQGDIIGSSEDFTIFGKRPGAVGYLVISNSCDFVNNKLDAILLALIYSFDIWYNPRAKKELKGLAGDLYKEANYTTKTTFFIPPHEAFGGSPSMAFIGDIKSVPIMPEVFRWLDVPGSGEDGLRSFLRGRFGLRWVKDANITKIKDDSVIMISNGEKELRLSLNNNETNLIMTYDDIKTTCFVVKKDKEKINIFFDNEKFLLNYKICSLKPPWREKLGYMVGDLFNRISTNSPEEDRIRDWTQKYKDNSSSASKNEGN
jgi:hypothetical protein